MLARVEYSRRFSEDDMDEEMKDHSSENRKRMLVALAILLGADIENDVEQYGKIPKDTLKRAK